MSAKLKIEGGFDAAEFLDKDWQNTPRLFRKAIDAGAIDITAHDLAGLACEQGVNARLVLETAGDYPWQVEHAPFEESRFASLPDTDWSLLVSDVERHLPETRVLLNAFRFIPDWRIDDLMIGYAPPGGSVGAHVDAYDVFLVQLEGRRHWHIAEHYDEDIIEGIDLRILKSFSSEQDWVLEPGDMLYLPPNVAHHGIAMDTRDDDGNEIHCLTASIGFRAPSLNDMASSYVDFIIDDADAEARYRDRTVNSCDNPAEIDSTTIQTFIDYLQQRLATEPGAVQRWLGESSSDNPMFDHMVIEHDSPCDSNTDFRQRILQTGLAASPYSNLLFSRLQSGKENCLLFVNGHTYETSEAVASLITADEIDAQQLLDAATDAELTIIRQLYNQGALMDRDD